MIKDFFALKIFESRMLDYNGDTAPALETQILEKGTRYITGVMTLSQQYLVQDTVPNIDKIFKFINHSVHYYWQQLGYRGTPHMKYHWANINIPGGATMMHDHAPSAVSGCFYIDVPPDSGDLFLSNPMEILLRHQPFEEHMIRHNEFAFDHKIEVSNGLLVMWPGYLVHRSGMNASDKNRILLGFDVDFDE